MSSEPLDAAPYLYGNYFALPGCTVLLRARLHPPCLMYPRPLGAFLASMSHGTLPACCGAASRRRGHLTFLSQENISQVPWGRPSWGLVLSAFTATRVVFWSLFPSVVRKFVPEDWKAVENNDGRTVLRFRCYGNLLLSSTLLTHRGSCHTALKYAPLSMKTHSDFDFSVICFNH